MEMTESRVAFLMSNQQYHPLMTPLEILKMLLYITYHWYQQNSREVIYERLTFAVLHTLLLSFTLSCHCWF